MGKIIGRTMILVESEEDALSENDLNQIFDEVVDKDSETFKILARFDKVLIDFTIPEGTWTPKMTRIKENLELPRLLPPGNVIDLSKALVLIGETCEAARVFILDPLDGSLYLALNKLGRENQMPYFQYKNGYAAIEGKVYFVGGYYNDHRLEYSESKALGELLEEGMMDDDVPNNVTAETENPDRGAIIKDSADEVRKSLEYGLPFADQNTEEYQKKKLEYENTLEPLYAQLPECNLDPEIVEFQMTEYDKWTEGRDNKIKARAAEIRARNLDVEVFNLKTGRWEPCFPKMNAPKPSPIVFVYGGKIYALVGHPDSIAPFEFLDPQCSSWTKLPDPPIPFYYKPVYMLNKDEGALLISFDVEIDDKIDGKPVSMFKFDLKSHEWSPIDQHLSKFYVDGASILRKGLDEPNFLKGCHAGDLMVCYDSVCKPGVPLIIVYDLRQKVVEHGGNASIDLSEYLDGYIDLEYSHGYLNCLGGLRFSLVIFYQRDHPFLSAVCTLSFQLKRCSTIRKASHMSEAQEASHMSEARKIEEVTFSLQNPLCRTFQLPNNVEFLFCKKMKECRRIMSRNFLFNCKTNKQSLFY